MTHAISLSTGGKSFEPHHLVELFSVLQLCLDFGTFTQVWTTTV
jgi:hypothetical protein